jgi:hypothetical protein
MPEREVLEGLLAATHLVVPDELPDTVAEHAAGLGALDAVMYVVDLEQRVLVPLPRQHRSTGGDVEIDTTLAGRAYRSLEVHEGTRDGVRTRWIPVVDGTERLGVLELAFDEAAPVDHEQTLGFAGLVAELLMTKTAYGPAFDRARRRRPLSVAAEVAWRLLPPLTFGTEHLVISGMVSPAYGLGGDSFHYAVDCEVARVAVFDAMGHGLAAGLLATAAMGSYRNSCVEGVDPATAAARIDATIDEVFADGFVTGITSELDIATGAFTWCNAGHPAPLLVRDGKLAKTLDAGLVPAYGIGVTATTATEQLQPGDRIVLYTDGIVEARTADGEFFGIERLVHTIGVASAEGQPPPETMRRVMHAVLDHHDGDLQDDATVVAVEWRGPGTDDLRVD